MPWIVEAASFIAGLIDSVVGGGGLITVPVFIELLGPSAIAIGTNKLPALAAQVAAGLVYFRARPPNFKLATQCFLISLFGAAAGAQLAASHLIPKLFFQLIPVVISPLILVLVLSRSAWAKKATQELNTESPTRLLGPAALGVLTAAVYDGLAGPGGGTLMFISLYFLGGMGPIAAMGIAKLSNLASALSSFTNYALLDAINWSVGARGVVPILLGSWIGAKVIVQQERTGGAERVKAIARYSLALIAVGIGIRFSWRLIVGE